MTTAINIDPGDLTHDSARESIVRWIEKRLNAAAVDTKEVAQKC